MHDVDAFCQGLIGWDVYIMRVFVTIRTGRCAPPVNTLVYRGARNRFGAKPPAARGCPLACSVSNEAIFTC
jgi:hypothetical protein